MAHTALICAITATVMVGALALRRHTTAIADPAACPAPHAQPGAAFSGPVLKVIDGQTICVALGPDPRDWMRVRVDTAHAARNALMSAVFARGLDCVAGTQTREGVNAACRQDGVPLDLLLKKPGTGAQSGAQSAAWR